MAGKQLLEPNRKSIMVPFADGLQDPRLGLAQNVSLYKQKDSFNGEFKYFTQRKALLHMQQLVDTGVVPSTPISSAYDVMTDPYYTVSNTTLVATQNNIYRTNLADLSGACTKLLPVGSPVALAYQTETFTDTRRVKFIRHQNTAVVGQDFVSVGLSSGSLITIDSSFNPVLTTVGVGLNNYGAYLDGYLFFAGDQSDSIYNCNLNDYTTWSTGVNYIRATQYPGKIVALCNIKNFIVALKEKSIEYFYNAGLNNTSPLQRNTSYTQQVGLSYKYSLAQHGDTIAFVGKQTSDTELAVFLMDGLGNAKRVSTPSVENQIALLGTLYDTDSISYSAFFSKVDGKLLYNLSILDPAGDSIQLMYDVIEDVWSTVTVSTPVWVANDPLLFGQPVLYPVTQSVVQNGLTYWLYDPSKIAGNAESCCVAIPQDNTKDRLLGYYGVENIYVPVEVKIPSMDFGTGNRKFMHDMSLSVIYPDTINHTVSFVKTVGYGRQTVTKSTTIGNNMSFKNWGQFVSGYIIYSAYDPSYVNGGNQQDTEPGLETTNVRINSINMEVSSGVS